MIESSFLPVMVIFETFTQFMGEVMKNFFSIYDKTICCQALGVEKKYSPAALVKVNFLKNLIYFLVLEPIFLDLQ